MHFVTEISATGVSIYIYIYITLIAYRYFTWNKFLTTQRVFIYTRAAF